MRVCECETAIRKSFWKNLRAWQVHHYRMLSYCHRFYRLPFPFFSWICYLPCSSSPSVGQHMNSTNHKLDKRLRMVSSIISYVSIYSWAPKKTQLSILHLFKSQKPIRLNLRILFFLNVSEWPFLFSTSFYCVFSPSSPTPACLLLSNITLCHSPITETRSGVSRLFVV